MLLHNSNRLHSVWSHPYLRLPILDDIQTKEYIDALGESALDDGQGWAINLYYFCSNRRHHPLHLMLVVVGGMLLPWMFCNRHRGGGGGCYQEGVDTVCGVDADDDDDGES